MRNGSFLACLGFLAAAAVSAPSVAMAHTVMTMPAPRDNSDSHKSGPCGGVARTTACTAYAAGATIPVKWKETVDHTGCFQIGLSTANDQNFTVLKQINDPSGTPTGMVYSDSVTIPSGVTCKDCTLVVRQLMKGSACVGNSTTTGPFEDVTGVSTYYSCADIRIGDSTPCASADAGTDAGTDAGEDEDDAGTTTGPDGGVTTTPTDGGGKLVDSGTGPTGTRPDLSGDDGCNVGPGGSSGLPLAALAGIIGAALVNRRRRRAG
ncbi:MAG: hypothetical protein JWP97_4874 [Labilithrix sp.]|nr:hypothetical protein [Labilithrix sp.]